MEGFVYLLCDGENFKIGMTKQKNINKRILELQTGNPNEIWCVNYYKTKYPHKIEQMLHFRHRQSNIKNEWFDMTAHDVVNFENECKDCEKLIKSLENNPFF